MFGLNYNPGLRRFRNIAGTLAIAGITLLAVMLGGCGNQTYPPTATTSPPPPATSPLATAANPLPAATKPPPTPIMDYWPPGYSKEGAIYLGEYNHDNWLTMIDDPDSDLDVTILGAMESAGHRLPVEALTKTDIDEKPYPAVSFQYHDGAFPIGFDEKGAWLILQPSEEEFWRYIVKDDADVPLYSYPDDEKTIEERLVSGDYEVMAIAGDWRDDPEKIWLMIRLDEKGNYGFVHAIEFNEKGEPASDLYGLNLDDIPTLLVDLINDGYEAIPLTSSGEIPDSNLELGEEIEKTVDGVKLSGNQLTRPTGDRFIHGGIAYVRTIGGPWQYVTKKEGFLGSAELGGESTQMIKRNTMYPIEAISSDGLSYQVNVRGNIVWVPIEGSKVYGVKISEIPVSDAVRLDPTPTPEPEPTQKPVPEDPIVTMLRRNMTAPLYKDSLPGALPPHVDYKGVTHRGTDKAMTQWTPLYSPVDGYVVQAGINMRNPAQGILNGYIVIAFKDKETNEIYYLQLGHSIPESQNGQRIFNVNWNPEKPIESYPHVNPGDLIAYAGGGSLLYGNNKSFGTEGHIEIRLTKNEGNPPRGFFLKEPDLVTKQNYRQIVYIFDSLAR